MTSASTSPLATTQRIEAGEARDLPPKTRLRAGHTAYRNSRTHTVTSASNQPTSRTGGLGFSDFSRLSSSNMMFVLGSEAAQVTAFNAYAELGVWRLVGTSRVLRHRGWGEPPRRVERMTDGHSTSDLACEISNALGGPR
jgi:hypothetical protein